MLQAFLFGRPNIERWNHTRLIRICESPVIPCEQHADRGHRSADDGKRNGEFDDAITQLTILHDVVDQIGHLSSPCWTCLKV
ncbi:hypothetical protein Bxe_A4211 [Paraburkholderia xenovorans LB400]|uniref:Uncharacterized protein n=1 Tax=Paraburkholderia xenovorans (strain LB400) TaxID=266265 RepID=Q146F0_PARXL|nr:hypothetical protein Bxe_A4211 [Paraburkholderia xenovorans LB400]